MTVPFNVTPSDVRVPLFYAELDNSQAGYFTQQQRTLIIGQKLSSAPGETNKPTIMARTDESRTQYGRGSMISRMHEIYRAGDSAGEVWMIALDDPAEGQAAEGSLAITGPATKAGTLSVYFGAQRVQVGVAVGDTATAIGTALAAAINANPDLPVTATSTTGTVMVTARHKGELGNDILVQLNMRGLAGGEWTPAGVQVAITAMAGGTGAPDLVEALAAMGDEEFDFIIHPYTDSASLDAFKMLMNDLTGRWSFNRQIYGHVYTAKRGTLSGLYASGKLRNDQHNTIDGFETLVPNPSWEYAASFGARTAVFTIANPARPTQTGELVGIMPAPPENRFIWSERQSLLTAGIATSVVNGGAVRIERAITTYQVNSWDQPDPSYLDSETMHQLSTVLRRLRSVITTKYARCSLADNGTPIPAGSGIVTPNMVRGELIAEYEKMQRAGLVENLEAFQEHLIVERNADNPNRLDILYPPDLINQLRVFAVLAQFRLQY